LFLDSGRLSEHLGKPLKRVKSLTVGVSPSGRKKKAMRRILAKSHAVLGFLGVACGAFGAHALQTRLTEVRFENWKTATLYLFVHALAGLLSLIICRKNTASLLFLVGCLIFSGSLYALVLVEMPILGAVTPVGGVLFLAGWVTLALTLKESESL
jgi:uncharacterized membrane protein YgdD (TMEM256/DUF423 family)